MLLVHFQIWWVPFWSLRPHTDNRHLNHYCVERKGDFAYVPRRLLDENLSLLLIILGAVEEKLVELIVKLFRLEP